MIRLRAAPRGARALLLAIAGIPLACAPERGGGAASVGTPAPPEPPIVDSLNPPILIPGGSFVDGSDDWDELQPPGSPYSKLDEDPGSWDVETFWLQQHEVTNEEFRRFAPEHAFEPGAERRPVVEVTFTQALAYARSLGGRLPTEVEWEYAARGTERRLYPWGDDPPTCERAHYRECEPHAPLPVPTSRGDRTPEGVHDLAGNVREWVAPVWFDPDRHPINHESRRLKGGSFEHPAFFLRGAAVTRSFPDGYSWDNIGFRVAWPAERR